MSRSISSLLSTSFGVLALSSVAVFPSVGHAQGGGISIDIGAEIGKALSQAMNKSTQRRVTMSSALVKVDPKTSTAVVEFTNTTEDTLEAEISLATSQPGVGGKESKTKQASALLSEEAAKPEANSDSIDSKWSLIPWFKDAPKTIKLAPGEKKSLTFRIAKPASAATGDYAAWLVASTLPGTAKQNNEVKSESSDGSSVSISFGGGGIVMMGPDGKPMMMTSATKVVYTVGDAK